MNPRANCESLPGKSLHSGKCLYECALCEKKFAAKSSLSRHGKVHYDEKRFRCELCNKWFGEEDPYKIHLSRHLDRVKLFICELCSYECNDNKLLKRHMLHEHDQGGSGVKECPFCRRKFLYIQEFKLHLLSHIKERSNFCKFCSFESSKKTSLIQHLKTHESSRQRNFGCDLCPRKFLTNGDLLRHVRIHLNEKPCKCDKCGKSFPALYKLQRHKRTHSDSRPFPCEYCGKGFKSKENLNEHTDIHSVLPQHQCPICPKQFRQRGVLLAHIKQVHTNVRAFKCGICRKDFPTSTHMKRHMRSHSKETASICALCGKRSGSKRELKTHMRVHDGEQVYPCVFCGKELANSLCLASHIRSHIGEKPFECRYCGKHFAQIGVAWRHQKTHQSDISSLASRQ